MKQIMAKIKLESVGVLFSLILLHIVKFILACGEWLFINMR